ncbi:Multi antimicrobial extrusion protein (Na(+)/drug antiporter), MATE family of MDR efflux pumps [hydrothermal vent metagenome]|uniref:Multi antimicrobial extrusion protein (Na(+)/drug antiporter), MATE family of MDR efflux pumps n=1 Tax=hydrothermal vent metagenome TaxID=652676 RepID=A0A3B0X5T8_9ZZZZ
MNIKNFKKDAILNILGLLLPTLIFLMLTPIMIDKLGAAAFGVIVLVQLTTGYMNILNFGISEAIIKHVAENLETDIDQAMRVMWVSLCVFLFAGIVGSAIIATIAPWLSYDVLEIPEHLRAETVTALYIAAGVFFLQMIAEFYRGCALGCQRFDIPNISRIARVTLSALFIVYALETGGGIVAVMVASFLGLAVGLIVNIIWMQLVIPLRFIRGGYKGILSQLLHFTKHIFATQFCGAFSNRIPQFVLGSVISVSNVAFYDVTTRAGDAASSIFTRIIQVFYPAFSGMDQDTRIPKILSILLSVMSIQLFLITPVTLMVVLEGHSLLAIWIDDVFSEAAKSIILFVSLSYFFRSLNNLPFYCAMSLNAPWIISRYAVLRLICVLVLIYPLVKVYGLDGAAATLFLVSLLNLGMIYKICSVIFKVNIYKLLLRPLIVHSVVSFALYFLYNNWFINTDFYTPFGALLFGIVQMLIAIVLGCLTKNDAVRLIRVFIKW